jgi:hypothetical protein
MSCSRVFGLTVVMILACLAAPALADTITLTNSGFEEPALGYIGSGWDTVGTDVPGWNNISAATFQDSGVAANMPAHTGTYFANLYQPDPGMYQLTDHEVASTDESFTLTFWENSDRDLQNMVATVFYADGGTPVALGSVTVGSHQTWNEFTLNASATAASVSHQVGIAFYSNNNYAAVDDVSLSYQTVTAPEPSGIAMLVAASIGLLAYAWRKAR